jgi:hypothetical protein
MNTAFSHSKQFYMFGKHMSFARNKKKLLFGLKKRSQNIPYENIEKNT